MAGGQAWRAWGLQVERLCIVVWVPGGGEFLFIDAFKAPEGKTLVMQKISYLGDPGLSKRGILWVGWPGSLSSCVVGNVFIGYGCL